MGNKNNGEIITIYTVVEKMRLSHKIEINNYHFKDREKADQFILEKKLKPIWLETNYTLIINTGLTLDNGQTVFILPESERLIT